MSVLDQHTAKTNDLISPNMNLLTSSSVLKSLRSNALCLLALLFVSLDTNLLISL